MGGGFDAHFMSLSEHRPAGKSARSHNNIGIELPYDASRLNRGGKHSEKGFKIVGNVVHRKLSLKSRNMNRIEVISRLGHKPRFHSRFVADKIYDRPGIFLFYVSGDGKGGIYVTARSSAGKKYIHFLLTLFLTELCRDIESIIPICAKSTSSAVPP